MSVYSVIIKIHNLIHRVFCEPFIKSAFAQCGSNVRVLKNCCFDGIENISVGNNVTFGYGTTILTTKAKLTIGNDVMLAPNVTIVTGNHRTDLVGRTMRSIKDNEKLPENDQDVIIEDDVWIGTNVTILKGVIIHRGSIIAAGAVVTHDVPEFQIYGGIPAKFISKRFSDEEMEKHCKILERNNI